MRGKIGVYNLHMQAMGGGEKLTLVLAEHLSSRHDVWLFHTGRLEVGSLERYFGVDLSRVKVTPLESRGPLLRLLEKVPGLRPPAFSLHHYLHLRKLGLDLFINSSYASGLACPAARGVFVCMFPYRRAPRRGAGSLPRRARDSFVSRLEKCVTGFAAEGVVDSYSTVVAISRYAGDWVRKRWARSPEIIYPPCEDMGPPAAKEKIVLHVGRFIADSGERELHRMGQDILLETFKGMTDLHRDGWELHFAGSVGGDEAAEFAAGLARGAKGAPVTFHFNAGLEEIRDLYRRAAVYWHATGYGSAADYPASQEHFGITTVEAMSAGAVPVVHNSGGQREIVTHGVDGFCWDDLPALVEQTFRLVDDPELRGRLSRRAIVSSRRFGRGAFAARVDRLIEGLMSGGPNAPGS